MFTIKNESTYLVKFITPQNRRYNYHIPQKDLNGEIVCLLESGYFYIEITDSDGEIVFDDALFANDDD